MDDRVKTPPPKRKPSANIVNNKEYVEYSGIQKYNIDNLDYKDSGITEIVGILGEDSVRYMICTNDSGYKFVVQLEGIVYNLNQFNHYRPAKEEEKKPLHSYIKGAFDMTTRNYEGVMSIKDKNIIILKYQGNSYTEEQYIIESDNYDQLTQHLRPYIIVKKSALSLKEQADISRISLAIRRESYNITNRILSDIYEKIEDINGIAETFKIYKTNFRRQIEREQDRTNISTINCEIEKMIKIQNEFIKIAPLVEQIYKTIPCEIKEMYYEESDA